MRVLVTGASGLVGTALRNRLAAEPDAQVFGADLRAESAGIEAVDLADPVATAALIREVQPHIVFHCAGAVGGGPLDELRASLIKPTRVLLDAVKADAPAAVVVIPGSAAEYGTLRNSSRGFSEGDASSPEAEYGRAKAEQTALALELAGRGVDARVCRVFNLIGPGIGPGFLVGRVAGRLHEIAAGDVDPVLTLGSLSSIRDYVDIRDACDAMLAVAHRGRSGRIYNVCTGQGRTARDVVEALVAASGLAVTIVESEGGSPRGGLDASVGSPARIADECGWAAKFDFDTSARDAVEQPWNG